MRWLSMLLWVGCGAGAVAARPATAAPDALETELRRHAEALCEAGPAIEVGDTVAGPCTSVAVRTAGDGELRAAIADVTLGGLLWSVLAVTDGRETRIGTLASGWSPGIGGHWAEGESVIEAVDLVPGGALEIHAGFSGAAGDSDMGSCDFRGRETAVHVVCTADGGLRCVAIETTRLRTWEHTTCDEVDETAPVELEANVREGWALDVVLGPVSTFTPAPGDTESPPLSGDVAIASLLARDDLTWPTAFTAIELFAN